MHRLRVVFRRGPLFLLCLSVVIFVRIALFFAKFTKIRALLIRKGQRNKGNEARAHVVARNVAKAAQFVPKATCMTQALSGQAVLSWFGVPTELVIGAASGASRGDAEHVDFHAWLMWEDSIILGGEELQGRNFSTLTRMPSVSS
jgi:hypothetical protein